MTNGGTSITFPSEGTCFAKRISRTDIFEGLSSFSFTIPKSLPTGQSVDFHFERNSQSNTTILGRYLIRTEHIALHAASTFGGAQIYISCAQVSVTGGGSGKPGPLVAFPGAYTGNVSFPLTCLPVSLRPLQEPGILINIYSPIPKNYTSPGPVRYFSHFSGVHRSTANRLSGPVKFNHATLSFLCNTIFIA